MIRLFEQHKIRKTSELEGMWDFIREDNGKAYRLPVPGCWEQHPDMLTYRGKGIYRRKIFLTEKKNLRLEFKGVSHTAAVSLDGQPVAEHYNAFTPFAGLAKGIEPGEHELTVAVDNGFSEKSALHVPNDYYTYGGIIRPVVLEEIPDLYIERIHFTPFCTDGIWSAHIEVTVANIGTKDAEFCLKGNLKGCGEKDLTEASGLPEHQNSAETRELPLSEMTGKACAGESVTLSMEQRFERIVPWTMECPFLYLLEQRLVVNGQETDDLIERVGFRTITLQGSSLLLNNRPVFLKGFNRHEDHGMAGCAIPLQLMVQDMELMQDMGANAVRTCHYPNDERFLDLCDERGILVWEENHARGLVQEQMENPNFDRQCQDCIREMIENHYNHPGIVIWGLLNECASETQVGRQKYQKQYGQVRSLDRSRPVTSATCRHFTDICLDLPDIVSFNMYSGWYQDVPVKERHEQEMAWIQKSGGAGKPVIVSEFGAAAMYGYRDRGRCKWSEERQADIIRENIEVYRQDKRLTGIFIWQFADCRVTEEGGWFASRARSHNNKGVVDEYRRPKLAYDVVKELYEGIK